MSQRAEELARDLQQATDDLLTTVEASTDEQWGAPVADGDWTQGFTAYHAATSIEGMVGMVRGMAAGEPLPPVTMEQIDQMNAAFHSQHANPTKAETLEAIRSGTPLAVEFVRGLSDQQLQHTARLAAANMDVSVDEVINMLLIGHTRNHLESITKAR